MCRLMGSHFHDWIDYNGVAFSIELLEKVLHNYGYQTYQNVFTVGVTQSGPSIKKKKWFNSL